MMYAYLRNSFLAIMALSILVFGVGCSSGGGRSGSRGTACKVNANPLPSEISSAQKVSMNSLQPGDGKLGLPVGKLVYTSFEVFSEAPSASQLKVVSFQGIHRKVDKDWRYTPTCARLTSRDQVEEHSFLIPAQIEVSSQGNLSFLGNFVGRTTFAPDVGFRFPLAPAADEVDSFEKAFLLENGVLQFYLLEQKQNDRPVYEIRGERTVDSRRLQFSMKFLFYAAGETVPEDLILRP